MATKIQLLTIYFCLLNLDIEGNCGILCKTVLNSSNLKIEVAFFALRIWNLNFIFLLFQIKSALEEEDGSSKIMQTPPAVPATNVAATPAPEVSPPKKKRPGRPPKNKKKVRIKQNLYH